jgi:hypothetical protein
MSILLVLAAALVGCLAGFATGSQLGRDGQKARRGSVFTTLVTIAVLATVGTNSAHFLLDRGLAFTTVDVLEAASYFVFGFAAAAAWVLAKPSGARWLLLALVPAAFIEPLKLAGALLLWWIKRT